MAYLGYQEEVKRKASELWYIDARFNIGDNTYTDYVPLVAKSGKSLLGVVLRETETLTAGGSTHATPVANSDVQDNFIQEVRIAPTVGATARSTALNRASVEAFEQMGLNLSKRSYPQASNATIAKSSTLNLTENIYIPIGGSTGAIQIKSGLTSNAYAAAPTPSNRNFVYLGIYGENSDITVFDHRPTATLPAGTPSLLQYFPDSIAPDYTGVLSASAVTNIYYESEGQMKMNLSSADFSWMQESVPDLAPSFTSGGYDVLWASVGQKRPDTYQTTLGSSVALNLLNLQVGEGGSQVPATPQATATIGPAAVRQRPSAYAGAAARPAASASRWGRRVA